MQPSLILVCLGALLFGASSFAAEKPNVLFLR